MATSTKKNLNRSTEPPPQPVSDAATDTKKPKKAASPNGHDPVPFGPMPPNVDFWDWLSGFSTDQWQFLIGYLWRTSPLTDRKASGKASSIKKYTSRFDLDTIMKEEGSGGYRIDLCATNPATAVQSRICQHYFNIMNLEYPPKVPYGDWLRDSENEMWAWAEPALKRRAAENSAEPPAAPGAAADPNAMFNTVLSGIRSLRGDKEENTGLATAVLNMVQKNQEAMIALTDPGQQLTTLQKLLDSMRPAEDKTTNLVIEMLREDLRETRQELREMRAAQMQPQNRKSIVEEIIDNLPKLQTVASALGFAKKTAEAGTDWGAVLIQVADKVADNLPVIVDAFKARNAPAGGPPNPWANALQNSQAATEAASQTATQAAAPQPAAGPTAATTAAGGTAATETAAPQPAAVDTDRARLQSILTNYGALINAITPFMIDHFKNGDLTGYDFRDWFLSRYGAVNWVSLKDQCGPKDLLALSQLHPHLKQQLAPPEKFYEFLMEFFTKQGEEPPGAHEEETATTAQGKEN